MSRESKTLARILRHTPEEIGLQLGPGGWVRVDTLLRLMKRAGNRMTRDELQAVAEQSDKRRFTLSEDGRSIRAAHGHSVNVDLGLMPSEPPKTLYHGTASANLDAIWAEGINPGRRQHVHLSAEPETARRVGIRHGKPVVLTVDAAGMYRDRLPLWKADNGIWLAEHVPPSYLGFA